MGEGKAKVKLAWFIFTLGESDPSWSVTMVHLHPRLSENRRRIHKWSFSLVHLPSPILKNSWVKVKLDLSWPSPRAKVNKTEALPSPILRLFSENGGRTFSMVHLHPAMYRGLGAEPPPSYLRQNRPWGLGAEPRNILSYLSCFATEGQCCASCIAPQVLYD